MIPFENSSWILTELLQDFQGLPSETHHIPGMALIGMLSQTVYHKVGNCFSNNFKPSYIPKAPQESLWQPVCNSLQGSWPCQHSLAETGHTHRKENEYGQALIPHYLRGASPNTGPLSSCPWRGEWQPTPIFLPGESHGQRSLVGFSPQGHKESDTTV